MLVYFLEAFGAKWERQEKKRPLESKLKGLSGKKKLVKENKATSNEPINFRVKPWSQDWLITAGAYHDFCSMKRLEVFLLPLERMLVNRRSLVSGFSNNLPVPIYTRSGWREAL